jgi:hypothetical protein
VSKIQHPFSFPNNATVTTAANSNVTINQHAYGTTAANSNVTTNQFSYGTTTLNFNNKRTFETCAQPAVFGEHPKCEECPSNLACAAGLPKELKIASNRQEQLDSFTLPCVEDGKLHLVFYKEKADNSTFLTGYPGHNTNITTNNQVSNGSFGYGLTRSNIR